MYIYPVADYSKSSLNSVNFLPYLIKIIFLTSDLSLFVNLHR